MRRAVRKDLLNMGVTQMRQEAAEKCPLCSEPSFLQHAKMTDRLFGSSGEWNILCCKNPGCGLVWISPKPTADILAGAYENYYTHAVTGQESFARRCYERFKRGYLSLRFGYLDTNLTVIDKMLGAVLAFLPHRRAAFDASVLWLEALPGGRLLEIGCGNGGRMALLKSLGWEVHGLEPDSSAAGIARDKGLDVSACTLGEAGLLSESFDAVLMCHVIEHLPDPRGTVNECLRILRPGGKLIMLTPNMESLGHRWYGRDWLHLDPPRHLFLFRRASMFKLLEGMTYSQISCQSTLRDANWTLAASRALQKRGRFTFGALPLIERVYGLIQLYHEWILLKINPNTGEELLVIVQK